MLNQFNTKVSGQKLCALIFELFVIHRLLTTIYQLITELARKKFEQAEQKLKYSRYILIRKGCSMKKYIFLILSFFCPHG